MLLHLDLEIAHYVKLERRIQQAVNLAVLHVIQDSLAIKQDYRTVIHVQQLNIRIYKDNQNASIVLLEERILMKDYLLVHYVMLVALLLLTVHRNVLLVLLVGLHHLKVFLLVLDVKLDSFNQALDKAAVHLVVLDYSLIQLD
jgi:hypothetical protein